MHRTILSAPLLALALVVAVGEPCAAQSKAPKSTLPGGPLGLAHYKGERWGIVGVGAANPGDAPADVLTMFYFNTYPGVQFGRQLWVPPDAKRTTWHPILPPANLPAGKGNTQVTSLLIDRSSGLEVSLKNPGGQMQYEGFLPLQQDPLASAVIGDGEDAEPVTALTLARFERRLSSRIVRVHGVALPPIVEALDGLDHLLVCGNELTGDAAGVVAIRRWLHDGGNLWIALDRVSPETVSLLVGDTFTGKVVDRVSLTEWKVVGTGPNEKRNAEKAPVQRINDFDRPVEMVRVEAPGLRVSHTVNDWPAALWLPAGKGTVLLTTLGGRGWIRPREKNDGPPFDPHHTAADLIANDSLRHIAFEFLKRREPPTLETKAWEPIVSEHVGYKIVGRWGVALVLGGFCGGLLALGIWLARRDRLAHLGWLGPLGALATAGVLVLMGQASRDAVPSTVAVGQLVEVSPRVNDVRVHGLLALYNMKEEPLGAADGGIFIPAQVGSNPGSKQRMVWTDMNQWHWENLALSAGVHLAPFEYSTSLPKPISAKATFGPEGLVGTYAAEPFQDLADAIVAIPMQRHLAVTLQPDGQFTAGPRDQLERGQFLSANVLSDEQRRRRTIFQALFADPKRPYPAQPTLLVWASPLDMKFLMPKDARRIGAALLAIPLEMQRPEPGSRLKIPSPFLSPRPLLTLEEARSAWYNPNLNSWLVPMTRGGHMMLRYPVPAETLPLKLDKVRVTISITAPGRTLEITTLDNNKIVTLTMSESPMGTLRFDLPAERMKIDDRGGLAVGLKVSELPSPRDWQITDLQLEIEGTALER